VTRHTVTSPARLAEGLARVRTDDYASTVEEMSLGACSVAVPVRHDDRVVASVGIVVPSLRRDRPRLVAALHVAARGIGRSLGGGPPPSGERGSSVSRLSLRFRGPACSPPGCLTDHEIPC
jgi:hypothetical protein